MVMPPIGLCCGSCTIPRTVPNTVANAFSIRISEITPMKISLRTTSPLLEIYERAVFDRAVVCVIRGRERLIATGLLTVGEERREPRENAENYLPLPQAPQSS